MEQMENKDGVMKETNKKNTGVDLQNSESLKENPAISDDNIHFLEEKTKVINDPIHGLMALHPLLIKIMDTPQFQRLRHIKQLGGAYFVYPGASHNRFEHSVGVAHLAGELARALGSKQPELGINKRDILCVQIAGLCHDLGHGPFSHLYDGIFIPKACGETQWKHEDASLRMFDHLVEKNNLKPLMKQYDLEFPESEEGKEEVQEKNKLQENDLKFIREMIQGKPLTKAQDQTSWPYQGRTEEKSFLYEIVANKLNGIDVDKFDYLARDAYHLGMQSNFDHKRFIMLARVCEVEEKPEETEETKKSNKRKKPDETKKSNKRKKPDETKKPEETKKPRKHICSRDKEVHDLYDMFHTRYCLYRRVCQHKTHKSIEIMISDAFLKADKHIKIKGSDEKTPCTLSTAKDDMVAYTKLTDQVFERILHPWSPAPELEEARKILERIVSRRLYKFVGEAKIPKEMIEDCKAEVAQDQAQDENQILQQRIDDLKPGLAQDLFQDENQEDNLEVPVVTFDYGKNEKDPINHTYFYSKDDNTRGFKISGNQKSKLLPETFSEKIMRVYCKNTENVNFKDAQEAFKRWCRKKKFTEPEDEEIAVRPNNE